MHDLTGIFVGCVCNWTQCLSRMDGTGIPNLVYSHILTVRNKIVKPRKDGGSNTHEDGKKTESKKK